jgi:hypothetical protein
MVEQSHVFVGVLGVGQPDLIQLQNECLLTGRLQLLGALEQLAQTHLGLLGLRQPGGGLAGKFRRYRLFGRVKCRNSGIHGQIGRDLRHWQAICTPVDAVAIQTALNAPKVTLKKSIGLSLCLLHPQITAKLGRLADKKPPP